jgi:hypothetical protein
MRKAREHIVKVSVSDLLALILGESHAPREILEENRLIHHRLGLDGEDEYSVVLGGIESFNGQESMSLRPHTMLADKPLCLVFKPDAVRSDAVYELKILRRYSDRDKLLVHGFLQLQLELYALGKERGWLLLYRYSDGEIEEIEVRLDPSIVEEVIALYLGMLEARARLSAKLIDECRCLKP